MRAGLLAAVVLLAFAAVRLPVVAEVLDSPEFCGICHLMDVQLQSHATSAHRDIGCNSCHSPRGFFRGPITEALVGTKHLTILVAGQSPLVPHASGWSKQIVEENCRLCHERLLRSLQHGAPEKRCVECHRQTPHGFSRDIREGVI